MGADDIEPSISEPVVELVEAALDELDGCLGGRCIARKPTEQLARLVDAGHPAPVPRQPNALRPLTAADVEHRHARLDVLGQLSGDDLLADDVPKVPQPSRPQPLDRLERFHIGSLAESARRG